MNADALRAERATRQAAHDVKGFDLTLARLRETRQALLREIEEETIRLASLARNAKNQLEYYESIQETLRKALLRYSASTK